MPETPPDQVTQLLVRWKHGDGEALQALVPLVYGELRRLAHHYLQSERPGHILQSTALVHEAYLRLVDRQPAGLQNRAHFFAVASQLMRQILVDHARSRRAAKRDGGCMLSLDEAVGFPQIANVDLIALDDALNELSNMNARQSRVIELRFFGGLTIDEASEVLGLSPATIERDWTNARAWLYREISRATQP